MNRLWIPFVTLAIIVLGGCKATKHPGITVVSARLGQTSDQAATVGLWLHLENPNNEALELLEFDYDVNVGGQTVYQGKRSAQMTLAQLSTRDVEIPAVVPFDKVSWPGGVPPEGAQIKVSGTLRYILPGAIAQTLFDTGVRRPRVSFEGGQTIMPAATPVPPTATAPAAAQ